MIDTNLTVVINQYLAIMHALGRVYLKEEWALRHLDNFLVDQHESDLGPQQFDDWCNSQCHLRSGVLLNRMRAVRKFCLYRQRTNPQCFVPNRLLFPGNHQPIRPYIFTGLEIGRLLNATHVLKPLPAVPLRPLTFRLVIVLLYTTGLRHGELRRLVIGDYCAEDRSLKIRESKFHKSRYLALSESAAKELEQFLNVRQKYPLPMSPATPLISCGYRSERSYSDTAIRVSLQKLYRQIGLSIGDGGYPRVHDYRHSFAVNALLRWYNKGIDTQAKLPQLATYMGHISIVSTEYYLPFVEELAAVAVERFAAQYSALVRPMPSLNEVQS